MVFTDASLTCLICREEEAELVTLCNHNYHKDCLKKWTERNKNKCPYTTFNGKLNYFLKNFKNNDEEIDVSFEDEDIEDIFSCFKGFKVDHRIIKHLILNIKNESTKSFALLLASKKGHLEIVKLLLDRGALIESKDVDYGRTSLMLASRKGHLGIVKLLLDHGALIDARDYEGSTALMNASGKGKLETVKFLFEHRALVEVKMKYIRI